MFSGMGGEHLLNEVGAAAGTCVVIVKLVVAGMAVQQLPRHRVQNGQRQVQRPKGGCVAAGSESGDECRNELRKRADSRFLTTGIPGGRETGGKGFRGEG